MYIYGREVKKMICSCGGEWESVGITKKEAEKHGCKRDKSGDLGCCVQAWKCKKCKTRITIALHAPEID